MLRKLHIIYYNTLKALIGFALRMFYRRHQVGGYAENVANNQAIVFTGNHQNALIDALNIVCTTNRYQQPTFMTRSDVFAPKVKPILTSFKMLPIYRQQDGVDTLQKNEEIFATCVRRLNRRESMIIFPEGNHNRQRRLRPLKKGASRIAFLAEEASGFTLGTLFIPVGLNYSQHLKFRGDLYVKYGKPVYIADFYEDYQTNPQRAMIRITQAISDHMKDTILHVSDRNWYEEIDFLRLIFEKSATNQLGLNPNDLGHLFDTGKKLISMLESRINENDPEWPGVAETAKKYKQALGRFRWRDHVVARGPYSMAGLIAKAIGLLVLLPVYLYGLINNYLPYMIPDRLAKKLFRDDHFHSSIKAAVGMFLFPIFYLIQSGICWALTDWRWALGYLVSLPLTGNFAYSYSVWVKKWYSQWKFSALIREGNEEVTAMKKARKELEDYMNKGVPHFSENLIGKEDRS
ncbi:MAG: 1-acyl-sn-glycerol-3-phosphate acyltransferase [Bacteroidia bacterium]